MNKFKVIVPAYNCEQWIERCLESIFNQDYWNFDVLVINDCSTDKTEEKIKNIPITGWLMDKFECIGNNERIGSGLANIIQGINYQYSKPDDIIVTIDGDDYLASNDVFSYLNEIYTNDVWLTYGSFLPLSGKYKNTCQPLDRIWTPTTIGNLIPVSVTPQTYRKSGFWCTSHLRTFRRHLWNRIKDEDLRDQNGEYYKTAWDMAFMYPMIEMAGTEHIKFIDKVLYMYNDLNPNCDGTINTQEQIKTGQRIQAKQCYETIKT